MKQKRVKGWILVGVKFSTMLVALSIISCSSPGTNKEVTVTSPPETTIVTSPSVTNKITVTVPSTETPPETVTPGTLVASDWWKLTGSLYLLTSQGTSGSGNYLQSVGVKAGLLGGGMYYIFSRLSTYWSGIQQANTIILFNASAESVMNISDWPTQYREVCPFTTEELTGINLPFALLKRDNNGLIRAIVVATSDGELTSFLSVMKDQQVPVNVAWTLSYSIIAAGKGGVTALNKKIEISDTNFCVAYPEGYDTDASNMLTWANQVAGKLQNWFPDLFVVIGSRLTIEIASTGDPSHASADPTRPSISFVAPSVAAKASSYYDADWYAGNIAHEIGHVILDRYRKLFGGYQRADCPNWFDEGFGEYLRLLVIGEQKFNEKYGRYKSEIPAIIANGTSGISDVYAGGAWVLRFMGAAFGTKTVIAVTTSTQGTFWGAVTEKTNLTQAQFEEQLKLWLKTIPP
jgi:hypothetical protein